MKKYAIYGLTGLLTLLFLGSAAAKLVAPAGVQAQFDKFGLLKWLTYIAIIELACLAAYLVPRTLWLGTLLLSAYLGGAIVAHLTVDEPPFFPALVLGLVWLLAYLKEPRLFAAQT